MGNQRREHKWKVHEFYIRQERPEEYAKNPLEWYTDDKIKDYTESKAIMRIQEKITRRALKILNLPAPARILDLGSGCGFASVFLKMKGYFPIALDISRKFLNYYHLTEMNLTNADMCFLPMRNEMFDGAISISAVQWILAEPSNTKRAEKLQYFARNLSNILKPRGKAVIQFYPKSDSLMKELGAAMVDHGGFLGNFIIDNPNSPKKRKIYLVAEKNA